MTIINYQFNLPELDANEYDAFDAVPDGVLYLDELEKNQLLEKFISRFVKTDSVAATSAYIDGMSRALKIKARDCLEEIQTSAELQRAFHFDEADIRRIDTWIKHDFAIEGLALSVGASASHSEYSSTSDTDFLASDGAAWLMEDDYSKTTSTPAVDTTFSYQKLIGNNRNWLWVSSAYLYSNIKLTDSDEAVVFTGDGSDTVIENYPYTEAVKTIGVTAKTKFIKIDDSVLLYTGIWTGKNIDAMPDSFSSGYSVWAGGQATQLFNTSWMASGEIERSGDDYTPSDIEDEQTRDNQTLTATANVSGQINDTWGEAFGYSYSEGDSVSSYSNSFTSKHKVWATTQAKSGDSKHVVQISVNGNQGLSRVARTDRPENIETETRAIGGTFSDQWKISQDFKFTPSIGGQANYSRGSWNGWYPSFWQSINMNWTPGDFDVGLYAGADEYTATFEYVQIEDGDYIPEGEYSRSQIYGSLSGDVSYEPQPWLKLALNGSVGKNYMQGFHPTDDFEYDGAVEISARLETVPAPLWLKASFGGSEYRSFDEFYPGSDYKSADWFASIAISLNDYRATTR